MEQVIRLRIYESAYWKEQCFALTGEHLQTLRRHSVTDFLACGLREAESLIDNAIKLKAIGGVYSNQRPTEFICLLLKLLQIQPEKEILVEYLLVEEFKYVNLPCTFSHQFRYGVIQPQVPRFQLCPALTFCRYLRALAAMYIRMTFRAVEVYELLEPLLKDYRKLRHLSMSEFQDTAST